MARIRSLDNIEVPSYPGAFDVEFTYRFGAPATYIDPADPDEATIELIYWRFDDYNVLVLQPRNPSAELYTALEEAVYRSMEGYDEDMEYD